MEHLYISVIIPSHKPQKYIWECLDSLNCQTIDKTKFEIVLILNGCEEPWRKTIEAWIASHTGLNINFIQTDTPGVSNARNLGMKYASGNLISFIDDDDYVSPSYLKDLYDKIDNDTVVLSNSISFIDGSNEFNGNYSLRRKYFELKDRQNIGLIESRSLFNGPCMKLIPKTIIKNSKFDTSLRNGEDSMFMFEISKNIKKIVLSDENAIYYRRFREASATTREKTIIERISNTSKLILGYTHKYFKHPLEYSCIFFITRILATIKGHLLFR